MEEGNINNINNNENSLLITLKNKEEELTKIKKGIR